MIKNIFKQAGFTLIELLVVATLFAVLSTAAVSLFLSTSTANSRAALGITVKQNGDYALGSMSTLIRNATRITSCTQSTLIVVGRDGGTTSYVFDAANARIASTSATGTVTLTSDKVRVNPATAGDSDVATEVANSGFFCYPATNPTSVSIRFVVRAGNPSTNNAIREVATQRFATTVGLRRY